MVTLRTASRQPVRISGEGIVYNHRPASLRAALPEHLARFTHSRSGKLGRIREPLPPDFRLEKSRCGPVDLLPHHRERHHGERKMERPQHDSLPTLQADVETLKRELEQMYQNVKATCGERREQATSTSSVGMVIKGK